MLRKYEHLVTLCQLRTTGQWAVLNGSKLTSPCLPRWGRCRPQAADEVCLLRRSAFYVRKVFCFNSASNNLFRLASLDSFPKGEALASTAIWDNSFIHNLFTHSITVLLQSCRCSLDAPAPSMRQVCSLIIFFFKSQIRSRVPLSLPRISAIDISSEVISEESTALIFRS